MRVATTRLICVLPGRLPTTDSTGPSPIDGEMNCHSVSHKKHPIYLSGTTVLTRAVRAGGAITTENGHLAARYGGLCYSGANCQQVHCSSST